MNPNQWTNQHIINGIKNEPTRSATLYTLFHKLDWRGAAISLLAQQGCSFEDAEEIANDALIYFDRNICKSQFEGRSLLKTYFLEIAKRQWWKRRASLRPSLEFDAAQYDTGEESVEVSYIAEERRQGFAESLAQIGERCKRIFELTMLNYSMEEIAKAMEFSSAEMAKKEAYRCRVRFRDFLEKHPVWKNRLK